MRPMDSNGDKRIRKDTQTDEDGIGDENCICCGEEPKAGHVHLQLLHNVQVFESNISKELNNNNKLTGDIHTLTVFTFPRLFKSWMRDCCKGWTSIQNSRRKLKTPREQTEISKRTKDNEENIQEIKEILKRPRNKESPGWYLYQPESFGERF